MLLPLGFDGHTQDRLESEHISVMKLSIEHRHFKKKKNGKNTPKSSRGTRTKSLRRGSPRLVGSVGTLLAFLDGRRMPRVGSCACLTSVKMLKGEGCRKRGAHAGKIR